MLPSLAAGAIVGVVEAVLAVAFAAFVFGGLLAARLPDAIGLYLVAATLTLGILAWRAGRRGVVGSVQDAAVAVLSVVAAATAAKAAAISQVIQATAVERVERPDVFLTVIAATLVVTVLCGVVFFALGTFRLGDLVRFVPYPVVGGFLAGTGWLLLKGGIYVASGVQPALRTVGDLTRQYELFRWGPAFVFGVLMLVGVRVLRRPLVIPAALGIGLVVFVIGMVLTGSSIEEARDGRWLLGPFETARLWEPWTLRALTGADWSAVLGQWAGIATAVFVAAVAILFNVSGTEVVLDRDLDTNEELRDAGVLNVVSGALGGIPGYHALSLTSLAQRMNVDARAAGLVAAVVPLAAVVFGAAFIELIPRMLVGGVLVLLGTAFIVEWVWDKRRSLPTVDYLVVLVILGGIVAWGFLPGVVLGLVLAFVLFAISYGRIDLVREAAFGTAYRSNVDRPSSERAVLGTMADRVQILRVHGYLFFGSAHNLLERIRKRAGSGSLRFLLVDLGRVTGLDASAAAAFAKVMSLARAVGFELVFAGASERVRAQLAQGGVASIDEVVRFEPDLDRALQRAEDVLLAEVDGDRLPDIGPGDAFEAMPSSLRPHLERLPLAAGAVLIRQGEPPTDVFVLESGRLRVELGTPEGRRMRLRTVLPGVVVGEVALYTGEPRTADVVAEEPSVVLRLSRESIERIAAQDPDLAAALHRWLASTLAERLGDTLRAVDALVD
ncbi:MAG TPA: SulP family inorganic anion transporter [Actinomycetota bacterium]|nr:SulP family inorganic anion transporter [Actinomycetota bacterium]